MCFVSCLLYIWGKIHLWAMLFTPPDVWKAIYEEELFLSYLFSQIRINFLRPKSGAQERNCKRRQGARSVKGWGPG